METGVRIVSGNANLPLAEQMAAHLNEKLVKATIRRFADQEIGVEIHENIRGEDVFVVQSTSYPANDNLVEMLLFLVAL